MNLKTGDKMGSISLVPELVDRTEVTYTCDAKHSFARIFAAEATIPTNWDCPHCGKIGTTAASSVVNDSKPAGKTHWEMVLERRSMAELEVLFTERVRQLRAG